MRLSGATRILYASGSGIYGDLGDVEVDEDHGPLSPISTYGASKLAGEALISAYCHMFDLSGYVFRFGNVVGPRQTHGVGYDFVRRLSNDPGHLLVLGDGRQSKSYIHVADVVEAVLLAADRTSVPVATYNVATGDYMTVGEIAHMALDVMGLDPQTTKLEFTGSDRGWKGDIPVVRLSTKRLRGLGWSNARSTRAADAGLLGVDPRGRYFGKDLMKVQPPGGRLAVFLDRDGVLNRPILRQGRPHPPDSLKDLEVYPDAAISLRRLKDAGFVPVVVTNQPDVARGLQRAEVVHEINRELRKRVEVAAVYVCFHDDATDATAGSRLRAFSSMPRSDLGLDLTRSFMVGDRWRDVEAGRRAGCRTVYIDRRYSECSPQDADVVTESLADAVSWIEGCEIS